MSRPFRYTFILVLVAIGTALAAVGGWRYARASAPVSGPIVVISIDTLRADHLPVYGYAHVRTPAIDALAADGVVFERAYSHVPQTLPAHAAILSGRLPFETGVRDNVGFVVKPGERLLPQMLRERGFTTGGVVSAYVLRKETGISQGFDFFDGEMPSSSPELSIGQVQRDGSASEAIAEHWLDAQRSSRVFLFLHLYEPHKPYTPPERFSEFAPYDGEIAYADEIVGRLVHYSESAPAVRPIDDRAALRSRRRARRSWRTGTRPLRVRRSDSRAAHRQAGGEPRSGPPRRRCRAARRPGADDPRLRESADSGQPAGPIAQAAARRHRPSARAGGLLRGALCPVSLRLERADGAHRRPLPLHQGAAARSCTISHTIPTSTTTSRPCAPRRRPRCAARSIG